MEDASHRDEQVVEIIGEKKNIYICQTLFIIAKTSKLNLNNPIINTFSFQVKGTQGSTEINVSRQQFTN